MEPTHQKNNNPLTVPIAIIVAGGLVAAAIFLRGDTALPAIAQPQQPAAFVPPPQLGALTLKPVDVTADHIRGNPNANVVLVEFSDTECPFCKRFHETMREIMSEYGKGGKVAWVYRHYPIPGLSGHENSPKQAEATECVAELGGNTAFWSVIDRMFDTVELQGTLDMSLLPKFAGEAGVDVAQFTACLEGGRKQGDVQSDLDDGSIAGVNGTPHSILVLKKAISANDKKALLGIMEPFRDQNGELPISFSMDGLRIGLNGALPLPVVKTTLDTLLK